MALPAHWHVFFGPANHALIILACRSEGKRGTLFTKFADSCEFLNLLTFWDQLKNPGERPA